MEKYKFYICDDSDEFRNVIGERIRSALSGIAECDIKEVSDGEKLVKLYPKEPADTVFLDIDMPILNGFETATELKRINENVCIVFITSFDDKVYESWNYTPFWFIRKSHLDDLDNVLYKLVKKFQTQIKEKSVIRLDGENRVYELVTSDVISVEAERHYVIVHRKSNADVKIRSRISDVQAQLDSFDFVRVNRGVIVSLREISALTSKNVVLFNGTIYSIGRDRTLEVKQRFFEYTRRNNI